MIFARNLEALPKRIGEALRIVEDQFQAEGLENALRQAEWVFQHVLDLDRLHLHLDSHRTLTSAEAGRIEALVARRLQREPLQYLLGETVFFGLTLKVRPGVLIPRPETEQVVEQTLSLLEFHSGPRVLDIGAGSGCIALALKHERPDADVWACDVSSEALAIARENADGLNLDVSFFEADVLKTSFADGKGTFDLIISNPPYIPRSEAETLQPEVRDHEPAQALFCEADPLQFYRAIIEHTRTRLRPGGILVFETHADYGEAVGTLLKTSGLERVELKADWAGHPRIAYGFAPDGGAL